MLENNIPIELNHDLGRFNDIAALQAQYPTGRPGDYARLNSTNTVWYWGAAAWTDSTISSLTLVDGAFLFDNIDPATISNPAAGKIYTGSSGGKVWIKDDTGTINYLATEGFVLALSI